MRRSEFHERSLLMLRLSALGAQALSPHADTGKRPRRLSSIITV
jgi:hypothetical protein